MSNKRYQNPSAADVARIYHKLDRPITPAVVDAAILAAARKAVRARPRLLPAPPRSGSARPRWRASLLVIGLLALFLSILASAPFFAQSL